MTTGTNPGDPLDDALGRFPYLDDDGFTARVLSRLPPRRRARAPLLVAAALLAAAAGSAVLLGPGAPLLAALVAFAD
jgi:hypothetical protein